MSQPLYVHPVHGKGIIWPPAHTGMVQFFRYSETVIPLYFLVHRSDLRVDPQECEADVHPSMTAQLLWLETFTGIEPLNIVGTSLCLANVSKKTINRERGQMTLADLKVMLTQLTVDGQLLLDLPGKVPQQIVRGTAIQHVGFVSAQWCFALFAAIPDIKPAEVKW